MELARKEFEKHESNPFNMVAVGFDASKEEVKEVRERERQKKEKLLSG